MSQMIDPSQVIEVRKDGSVSVKTVNVEKTMTQQQFADEADINHIMARYEKTGDPGILKKGGFYADVSELPSYDEMLSTIIKADEAFLTLPAKTRLRFNNSPGELLEFLRHPSNYDEGVSLGLLDKASPPPAMVSSQTNPSQPNETTSIALTSTK